MNSQSSNTVVIIRDMLKKKKKKRRAVVSKHALKRQGIFMKEAAFQVKLVGLVGGPEK